jgi:hypothetical protein
MEILIEKAVEKKVGPLEDLVRQQAGQVRELEGALMRILQNQEKGVSELGGLICKLGEVVEEKEREWSKHFGGFTEPFGKVFVKAIDGIHERIRKLEDEKAWKERRGERGGAQPQPSMREAKETKRAPLPPQEEVRPGQKKVEILQRPGKEEARPPPPRSQPPRAPRTQVQAPREPEKKSFAQAARSAGGKKEEEWTKVEKKGPKQGERRLAEAKNTTLESRRVIFVRDQRAGRCGKSPLDILSAINRALLNANAEPFVRLRNISRNEKGTVTGLTKEGGTAVMFLKYRDIILKAARSQDGGIIDIETNESWVKLIVHFVSIERYGGRGLGVSGKLKDDIEAENEGIRVPLASRWLGSPRAVIERRARGEIKESSVVITIKGEEAARRLLKKGVTIVGRSHEVTSYEEERADSQCGTCQGWGHIEIKCAFPTNPRCAICAKGHRTNQHVCQVVGCGAGKECAHDDTKCANCRGAHMATSATCPKRKEAIERAKKDRLEGRRRTPLQPRAEPLQEVPDSQETAASQRIVELTESEADREENLMDLDEPAGTQDKGKRTLEEGEREEEARIRGLEKEENRKKEEAVARVLAEPRRAVTPQMIAEAMIRIREEHARQSATLELRQSTGGIKGEADYAIGLYRELVEYQRNVREGAELNMVLPRMERQSEFEEHIREAIREGATKERELQRELELFVRRGGRPLTPRPEPRRRRASVGDTNMGNTPAVLKPREKGLDESQHAGGSPEC